MSDTILELVALRYRYKEGVSMVVQQRRDIVADGGVSRKAVYYRVWSILRTLTLGLGYVQQMKRDLPAGLSEIIFAVGSGVYRGLLPASKRGTSYIAKNK